MGGRLACLVAAVAVGVSMLVSVATASATTYCVNNPSCTGTDVATVQDALDAASANAGNDRVRIGAGTYSKSGGFLYSSAALNNAVTIIGAGQASMTLRVPQDPTSFDTVLSINDRSSVSRLTIRIPGTAGVNHFSDTGLSLKGADARHMTVNAASTANNDAGVRLSQASSVADSTVSLPYAASTASSVGLISVGQTAVSRTTVKADTAFSNSTNGDVAKLTRVSLTPGDYGYGAWTDAGPVSIKDSLINLGSAIFGIGLRVDNSNGSPTPKSIHADHVTIVGGGANSTGLAVLARAPVNNGKQVATATLTNSTIRGPDTSIDREAQNTAATNPGKSMATVKTAYSNYSHAAAIDFNGPNGHGLITDANFVPGTPTFVGGGDYTPAPGSILIDSGDPAFSGGVDLAGDPRVADGDGDGMAVTDLGAYERQP